MKGISKNKLVWERLYVGPFSRNEAQALVKELKAIADITRNGISDAKIRRRNDTDKYDVYIQAELYTSPNGKRLL